MSLLTNITAGYQFEETSGDASDCVGTNTMTASAAAPGTGTGKVGNCRTFNGTNQYFGHIDNAVFNPGTNDFSIAFWAKATSLSNRYIYSHQKTTSPFNGVGIYVSTAGKVVVETSDGTFASQTGTSTAFADNAFHSVVVTRSGSTILIYVDGSLDTTGSGRSGSLDFSVGAGIGDFSDNTTTWNGSIDEFYIWSRVLTSGEVSQYHNGGNGLPFSSFGGTSNGSAFQQNAFQPNAFQVGGPPIVSAVTTGAGAVSASATKIASSVKGATGTVAATKTVTVPTNLKGITEHIAASATEKASSVKSITETVAATAAKLASSVKSVSESVAAHSAEVASSVNSDTGTTGASATVRVLTNAKGGAAAVGATAIVEAHQPSGGGSAIAVGGNLGIRIDSDMEVERIVSLIRRVRDHAERKAATRKKRDEAYLLAALAIWDE